jgi:hypothetical protein
MFPGSQESAAFFTIKIKSKGSCFYEKSYPNGFFHVVCQPRNPASG